MTAPRRARSVASALLSAAATGMSVGAELTQRASTRLRPDEGPGPVRQRPGAGGAAGGVRTAPSVAVQGPGEDLGLEHVRTHETHAEELAERPAQEVIAALEELSTTELRGLYEHEQVNRRRKTVLRAIERALTPSGT